MDKYTKLFLDSVESEENRKGYTASILTLRGKVEEIWKYPQHRYFTDHSIKHSERVLQYLWLLTRPCYPKLADAEIYILVVAAYLHDIGMQSEKLGPEHLKRNRKIHQELSVEMIETLDLGVLQLYKDYICLVVRAHRHVPLDDDVYKTTRLRGEQVRPRLLGSILRLADELDLTDERVNMSRQQFQNPGIEALVHWYRHYYAKDVEVNEATNRIRITFHFPLQQRDECEYAIANYVQIIVADTLREIEAYVHDDKAVFKLDYPDISGSQNVDPLPDNILEKLRLETDAKVTESGERNSLSSAASTNDDLRNAIHEAEQRESTGKPIDAAVRFKGIADRFMRNKQYMRAADYADRAAKIFAASDDKRAWEAHLLAAQAHLGRNDPGIAALSSNAALLRVSAQGDQVAEVHVRLVVGTIDRLLVDRVRAEENLSECLRLISVIQQGGKTVEESLQAAVYDEFAQTALLDDQWDDAATHLREGLAVLTEAPSRLRLLIRLANVYLELGRADDAAPSVADALSLVDASEDATTKAAVSACAAHLATLRHDLDGMIAHYDTAIGALAGHAEEPYAAMLYHEKHNQLLSAGVAGMKKELASNEEATRIDLARERLHPIVDADQLELEGVAAAADGETPDALQSYNQSLSIYRQYGAFESVRRTIKRLAQLYEQGDKPISALALYARIGAIEDVERLATAQVQRLGSVDDMESFLRSINISRTDHARVGRAVVYREFVDAVPDSLIPSIVDNLINDIVNGRDSSSHHLSVRRAAIQALAAFSRRIPQDRLEIVVETYLTIPRKGSWWTTERLAIKGMAFLASQHHAMPESLVTRVATALLNRTTSESFDLLRDESLGAAFTIAKYVGGKQRDAVVEYLQGREQGPMSIAYLTALDAPPPRLDEVVGKILEHISPRVTRTEGNVDITEGGYAPRIFSYFKKHLTLSCLKEIVEHFVRDYDNVDATIRLRAEMLEELSDLADLIPDQDIDRCYSTFLRASNGDIVLDASEVFDMEMARNPFSRIHVFTGTKAEIAASGAWGLASLYHRLSQEQRLEVLKALRELGDLDDATLRQRVAQAMGELRDLDNNGLEQLAVSIIVLLHNSDPAVRAWMVRSVATLYEHNSLDVHRTIIERILDLGVRDVYLDVRRAVAFALNRLPIASLPLDLSDAATKARTRLEADVDFRVRMLLVGQGE